MTAVAFDTLAFVRRMVAAGVPREQAEAQADAMKEVFIHNVDALVTRDYLDTRFQEFEARLQGRMDVRFERMEGKLRLQFWMLGLTMACVVIPLMQDLAAW